jgi:hypothetical protein
MKKQTISLGLSLLAWASLSACNKADNTNVFDQSSTDGTSPADATLGFSLTASSGAGIDSILHQFNQFGTRCKISADAAPSDTKCLYNIREQDLYANGLSYTVNVPASMCKYVGEMPYYYYAQEPGTGSLDIAVSITGTSVTSCTIDGAPGVVAGGVCTYPKGSYSNGSGLKCKYDHVSPSNPNGRNCCVGNYTLTTTTTTGMTTSTTSVQSDWGGTFLNCLSGPGMQSDWPKDAGGYPSYLISSVPPTGLSRTFKVVKPIEGSQGKSFNSYAANFFNWTDYAAQTWSDSPIANVRPKAIRPIQDVGSVPIPSTNEAYLVNCLDNAGETIHSLRLYVNEWDSVENYALYFSSNGTQGSPISSGVVGGGGANDCSGAIPGSPCDNYYSWNRPSMMTRFPGY